MDRHSLFFVSEIEEILEENVYIQGLYNELDKINKKDNKSKKILTKRFIERVIEDYDRSYIEFSDDYRNNIIEEYLNLFFNLFITFSQLYKNKYNKVLDKYMNYITFLEETKYYDLMKNKIKSIKKSYKLYIYDKNDLTQKLKNINLTLDILQEKYNRNNLSQDICEQYIKNDHKLQKIVNSLLNYLNENNIIYNTIDNNLIRLSESRIIKRTEDHHLFMNLYKTIENTIFDIIKNPLILK